MEFGSIKAVVTGGASGLGNGVARHIIAAGGQVLMLDVNAELGDRAAAELGSRARFAAVDVTSESSVDAALAEAQEAFGGLNAAISCAGVVGNGRVIGRDGPMALEYFARTVNINLIGTFNVARAAANLMKDNETDAGGERGVIINTASVAAYEGQIGQAAYSASKGGVVGLTLPLARELARFGIRVMTIAPGLFMTPMLASLPQDAQDALGASVPFPPRLGRVDEYAALVQSIVENSMLNGEVIRLDGAIRLSAR
ncbi:MAG: SDR family NAD(P)-dependent oxidoreductase [Gammaproteobacteria bacterium]|nr:SDR family NAD(P)-dependent oxidoreductase [Gammaproteobacteria bacterium]